MNYTGGKQKKCEVKKELKRRCTTIRGYEELIGAWRNPMSGLFEFITFRDYCGGVTEDMCSLLAIYSSGLDIYLSNKKEYDEQGWYLLNYDGGYLLLKDNWSK